MTTQTQTIYTIRRRLPWNTIDDVDIDLRHKPDGTWLLVTTVFAIPITAEDAQYALEHARDDKYTTITEEVRPY